MRWFRFYDEALNDPKVQRLSPELFKTWVNLLCVASANDGRLPGLDDLAFALRLDERATVDAVSKLISAGLVDDDGTTLTPHNWDGRQFQSDTSAERMRRHRERKRKGRNGGGDGSDGGPGDGRDVTPPSQVTAPESESESESEAEQSQRARESSSSESRRRAGDDEEVRARAVLFDRSDEEGEPLPDDFPLTDAMVAMGEREGLAHEDTRREFERFCAHYREVGSRRFNWHGTFRAWIRTAVDRERRARREGVRGEQRAPVSRLELYREAAARVAAARGHS